MTDIAKPTAVGAVKRRTVAKEMASNGQIAVNGRTVKPAYQVREHDIITIKGVRGRTIEVLALPIGSVPKERRPEYFKELPS